MDKKKNNYTLFKKKKEKIVINGCGTRGIKHLLETDGDSKSASSHPSVVDYFPLTAYPIVFIYLFVYLYYTICRIVSITCPNRMEMLARDLQRTRGDVSECYK